MAKLLDKMWSCECERGKFRLCRTTYFIALSSWLFLHLCRPSFTDIALRPGGRTKFNLGPAARNAAGGCVKRGCHLHNALENETRASIEVTDAAGTHTHQTHFWHFLRRHDANWRQRNRKGMEWGWNWVEKIHVSTGKTCTNLYNQKHLDRVVRIFNQKPCPLIKRKQKLQIYTGLLLL